MKSERRDVEFPMWRKKVDRSLFEHNGTAIPKWVCRMWETEGTFPDLKGKKDKRSLISITFNNHKFEGQITSSWPKKRADKIYRLWFGDDPKGELKDVFVMSFMRDIEARLRKENTTVIEEEIPFWEFLDIEFDSQNKALHFSAHYTHVPTFPALFKRLTYSPALKRIDDELARKGEFRIHKQDWRDRDKYELEIGEENVIYSLVDTERKLLYIGEAEHLIRRFRQGHPSINNWNKYRYDVLPSSIGKRERVAIERMMIRAFASVLTNKSGVDSLEISAYRLANDKIDS